jgi:DHA1 family bicyclomycin/chloramphenicol resistance-like MFS transporter
MIRDVLAGAEAQKLFTRVAMIFGIAPAIAPIIGGGLLRWGWPSTFWLVGGLALALLVATALLMPETHSVEARTKLSVAGLWRTYKSMITERRFLLLSSAAALNFASLWLYICSAPSFIMHTLKLSERDFGWLFVPVIGGMISANFVSGRLAGRISADRQIGVAFAICALAMALNVCVSIVDALLVLPWAVVPVFIHSFGTSLMFPVFTLTILDMYSGHRGSASSLQAFLSLALNAVVAGLVSPFIAANTPAMAAMASLLLFGAWLCWMRELSNRSAKRAH